MKIITRWFLALLDGVPTGGAWLDFFWILSKPPSLTIFVLVWPWHSIKFFESLARIRPRMSSSLWWRRLNMAGGLRTTVSFPSHYSESQKRILTLFYKYICILTSRVIQLQQCMCRLGLSNMWHDLTVRKIVLSNTAGTVLYVIVRTPSLFSLSLCTTPPYGT